MFASCQKRACLPTPHDIQSPPLAADTEQAHIGAPMAHLRVTCLCGAIYEVIENERPLKVAFKVRLVRQGIIPTGQSYWSSAAREDRE